MPALGFGLFQTSPEEAQQAVAWALQAGYRHIDSAYGYHNEAPAGAAVLASGIPRDQIFFTSKIIRLEGDMDYDKAVAQVAETVQRSGLDYLDLVLIHTPFGGPEGRKGAWRALVEAVEAGKVRSIGVSNYGVHHLEELESYITELEAERGGKGKGGVVSVGQWEIHPWLPRNDIVQWCQSRGIVVQAYSPLVRGQKADDAVLASIARKHNKSWAQVLTRWSLQKGYSPLPKSVKEERIRDNADVYDFELDEKAMKNLHMPEEYYISGWDPTVAPLEK
jgi:diketogulonate reductase-like aldo/keto reductase